MSILEKVYDVSPIWFQNIMCSVSGFQKNRSRYGKQYWEYRKFLEEFETWPIERKREYQFTELKKFLTFAVNNSELYRELYKEIDINSFTSIDDLKKLPIVDKEMLRKNESKLSTIGRKGAVLTTTGGTTGKILAVRYTKEDFMRRMALLDHFKAQVGFENREMRRAIFNAKYIVPTGQKKKIYWRYNAACKQMIYSSFHLSQNNIPFYIESLNRFKPESIEGYFTSILEIADYMKRNGIKSQFKPVAIFPTSETVTPSGRKTIEEVFGCKVYDQYASSEGAPFVSECQEQIMHVEMADGVIENISDDDSEVLVTSFTTHGTPLIRYRIGDKMVFSKEQVCKCGRCSTIVSSMQGRSLDYLYTTEGAKVTEFDIMLDCLPKMLVHAQFHKKNKKEVTILLQVDNNYYIPDFEEKLTREAKKCLGEDMSVKIIIVDEIPRAASGKYRLIINECDK